MKINVNNSSVEFFEQEISLDRNGVYLMKGPNGIGKTSILKDIVFTRRFKEHNRNYFAYAEQGPEKYDISIINYLKRFNIEVDEDEMYQLLIKFDLEHLDINSTLLSVSGGELIKLNIIACLIKKTKYIFLDEPTNNLDNSSVEILKEVIENVAIDRVVLIVSHDPRLLFENAHEIFVKNNAIEVNYAKTRKENSWTNCNITRIDYPLGKIVRRHFGRFASIINFLVLLIYTFFIISFNYFIFKNFYQHPELTNKDDSLLIYSVDMEYGEFNQRYAQSAGLKVDDNRYYSMIQYNDIPEIVDNSYTMDVYIENDVYADYLADVIANRSETLECIEVSIPYTILENYIMQINPWFSIDYLLEGRYPYDDKNEIVLSQTIIDSKYPNKKINDKVIFEGEQYTLVGIHYLDIYMVSYNGESEYFYKYNSETFEKFVEEQVNYKKSIDAPETYVYKPVSIVVQAEKGKEEFMLKRLFQNYPANNYFSYSYANDIAEYENAKLIKGAWIGNVVVTSAIGVFFSLVNRKRCETYIVEAESFDNYYLSRPLTYRVLSASELILSTFVLVVSTIIVKKISVCNAETVLTCVSCCILFVASFIQHMKVLRMGCK